MNTLKGTTNRLTLVAAALLSLGVGAASAQDFTRPNSDIRALEVPADGSVTTARAEYNALALETRSVTNGASDNSWARHVWGGVHSR